MCIQLFNCFCNSYEKPSHASFINVDRSTFIGSDSLFTTQILSRILSSYKRTESFIFTHPVSLFYYLRIKIYQKQFAITPGTVSGVTAKAFQKIPVFCTAIYIWRAWFMKLRTKIRLTFSDGLFFLILFKFRIQNYVTWNLNSENIGRSQLQVVINSALWDESYLTCGVQTIVIKNIITGCFIFSGTSSMVLFLA